VVNSHVFISGDTGVVKSVLLRWPSERKAYMGCGYLPCGDTDFVYSQAELLLCLICVSIIESLTSLSHLFRMDNARDNARWRPWEREEEETSGSDGTIGVVPTDVDGGVINPPIVDGARTNVNVSTDEPPGVVTAERCSEGHNGSSSGPSGGVGSSGAGPSNGGTNSLSCESRIPTVVADFEDPPIDIIDEGPRVSTGGASGGPGVQHMVSGGAGASGAGPSGRAGTSGIINSSRKVRQYKSIITY